MAHRPKPAAQRSAPGALTAHSRPKRTAKTARIEIADRSVRYSDPYGERVLDAAGGYDVTQRPASRQELLDALGPAQELFPNEAAGFEDASCSLVVTKDGYRLYINPIDADNLQLVESSESDPPFVATYTRAP